MNRWSASQGELVLLCSVPLWLLIVYSVFLERCVDVGAPAGLLSNCTIVAGPLGQVTSTTGADERDSVDLVSNTRSSACSVMIMHSPLQGSVLDRLLSSLLPSTVATIQQMTTLALKIHRACPLDTVANLQLQLELKLSLLRHAPCAVISHR